MNEYTLSTDNFFKAKVLKDYDAVYTLLVRLLLLEPGSIPGHPKMGIGLIKNYRYSDQDKLSEIQQDIIDQITTYLPDFQTTEVQLGLENGELSIKIIIDNMSFDFTTSNEPTNKTLTSLSSGLYEQI